MSEPVDDLMDAPYDGRPVVFDTELVVECGDGGRASHQKRVFVFARHSQKSRGSGWVLQKASSTANPDDVAERRPLAIGARS
ncbi:hypothetical protein [Amycolatopsis sp. Hca4]|uniref:hypothetical protein n=1 Tax=Amycolatopsis sp. Hca4 TaxID=2742131 RepID=UPI0015914628|nr:hypothetical protein [Amycolatopsis sp. Hca4]QKV74555.1 hypothetical protein HUT10_12815 [Amycolatopsis sp. Hca4]